MTEPFDTSLPPLYAQWLGALLPAPPPAETRATCHDCAMCVKADGTPPESAYVFTRDTKCCVYLPELPNFLVGRILADAEGPGRDSVAARIAARIAVTPLGAARPPSYDLLHRNAVSVLGRSESLRCPHYQVEGGTCGIHAHRNHTCATYFCKHERGQTGARLWNTVKLLLEAIEQDLARWCALQLDVEHAALVKIVANEVQAPKPDGDALDGRVSDAAWAEWWGHWAGREEDFFRQCGEKVSALSWEEVLAICGPRVHVLARLVERSHDRMTGPGLPDPLRLGVFTMNAMGAQGVQVVTHSSTDPILLPSLLLSVLHYFDGRPTAEVLQHMADERGITLDEPLVRQLVDWGVLTA